MQGIHQLLVLTTAFSALLLGACAGSQSTKTESAEACPIGEVRVCTGQKKNRRSTGYRLGEKSTCSCERQEAS